MPTARPSPRAPARPDWVDRMVPGHWYRISGDHPDLGLPPTPVGTRYLEDDDPAGDRVLNPARGVRERLRRSLGRPPRAPWSGRMGFPAITEAWNGAVLATGFGESGSMVVFGGGHDDYYGSDVHAFDLATREWSRIADGYVTGQPHEYGNGAYYPDSVYPDGSPLPPHTYGYVQYDPVGNDYLLLKGNTELGPDVKAAAIPHIFNLDTLSWRRGPQHPEAILNSGGFSTWDSRRRILWGHSGDDGGGNAFIAFSPDGRNADGTHGRWDSFYPNKFAGVANHNAMQLDPVRDVMVVLVHARDALYGINPHRPEESALPLSSFGERPRIVECAAVDYAAALDRLVYYSAQQGPCIHLVQPPAVDSWDGLASHEWRWQQVLSPENMLDPARDATSVSRHAVNAGHTFGRFRTATWGGTDVALLVRHVDSPVYALRLAA